MSSGKTNKRLIIIIAVLLITNIAVFSYFLWFKKSHHDDKSARSKNGISETLKKYAGFSDEQVARYKELKDKQRQTIRPMFDHMRTLKDSLFILIGSQEPSDSLINAMTDKIALQQKSIDLQTFNYFRGLRSLCTTEQLPKYDSIVINMLKEMGGGPVSPKKNTKNK